MMIPTAGNINPESIRSLWNPSLNMAFLLYHSWRFSPNQIALLFCLITVGGFDIVIPYSMLERQQNHLSKFLHPTVQDIIFNNPNSPYKHEEISS
jgi:hypothetical protein